MRKREPKLILNVTRGNIVCERGVIADRALPRMRGLLGRRRLATGEGLLLTPAPSIHTAFMRFPIDVVFLDSDYKIIKLIERLDPWRTAAARRARAVLELAAGESARRGLSLNDCLAIVDQPEDQSGTVPATRLLLVSSDRRFRFAASALLTQRGYSVTVSKSADDLTEVATHSGAEVVVLDTGSSLTAAAREASRLRADLPSIGLVAVSAEPTDSLSTLRVLSKWSSLESLSAAIEQARGANGYASR